MIKVTRTAIPAVLTNNQQQWTKDLLALIKKHGSYSAVPRAERDAVVNNYGHADIKQAVKDLTKGKCAYCESFIEHIDFPHIEHFYPKSVHPIHTFDWNNFFPSCTKCNVSKGNLDTKAVPFVHPELDYPEEYFIFKDLVLEVSPTSPDSLKSTNTIKHCDLQRVDLTRSYSQIYFALRDSERNLCIAVEVYNDLVQNAAKFRKANDIRNAMDNLKAQAMPDAQYAGFVKHWLKNSSTISQCIAIINNHGRDLAILGCYSL